MGINQAYYDGSIRSCILRAYPHPIKVPVTPVLHLRENEIMKAKSFALDKQLGQYDQVVLFEFAPQSGQLNINTDMAISIAEGIVQKTNAAVILSSATKITHANKAIIDGSTLTLRETAALTHFCNFLIGCSSGISWISTSEAAKRLPMVQLINPQTTWVNPISRDFERFHLPVETVIDLTDFDTEKVIDCVSTAFTHFAEARKTYHQPIPLHFKTTTDIVYNLLCYLEFWAIRTHIKVNREVYGNNSSFYAAVAKGFIIFPFRLIRNLLKKRIIR
jgi:hypothetical protein